MKKILLLFLFLASIWFIVSHSWLIVSTGTALVGMFVLFLVVGLLISQVPKWL